MNLSAIVAMTDDGVIGRNNGLPWRLPEDLIRFKQLTLGHAIVMGRKTYDSIGKPLPGRKNIVLTRDRAFHVEGVTVVHDWAGALTESAAFSDQAFVIGGAEIFRQALAMPALTRIYFTLIHAAIPGDTYFPLLDWKQRFSIEKQSDHVGQKADPLKFSFVDVVRFSH
jgi:dihydrofolate reductase